MSQVCSEQRTMWSFAALHAQDHQTPRACLCTSFQAGNYSCLSQWSWQQCRKCHHYLTVIDCKWNKEAKGNKMGPPNHRVGRPAAGQEVWAGKVQEAQAVAVTLKFS